MEAFYVIWFFAAIIPQIVGFVSYLLLKKHDDSLAHISGVIIPPVSSFYLFQWLIAPIDFSSLGQGAALLFFGSFLQLFFSLLIQLAIHNRHKFSEDQLP